MAEIVYVPGNRFDFVNVAKPFTKVPVPIVRPSFLKATIPVGDGPFDWTTALKVTD
jgi:hypothetical protein